VGGFDVRLETQRNAESSFRRWRDRWFESTSLQRRVNEGNSNDFAGFSSCSAATRSATADATHLLAFTPAKALRRSTAESGPEAVAFGVTTSSGTTLSDAQPWVDRLINAFGSPNNCNAREICAWHQQYARAFTTGTGIDMPDCTQAGCIFCGA